MIPILYKNTETAFRTNGLGRLDALTCTVSRRLNDFDTLEMSYPSYGEHARELIPGNIIYCETGEGLQPYRIYEVQKAFQTFEVYANHLSYDLCGYPVKPFTAQTASAAIGALSTRAVIATPFTFSTNLSVTGELIIEKPDSIRAVMGGSDESILGVYGGEWKFDHYSCQLLAARGSDKGVEIRYGKNLTDITAIGNNEEAYTGCFAYYSNSGTYVSSNVQYLDGTAVPQKILITDHTGDFDSTPTTAQLDTLAAADLLNVGPLSSLSVSFVPTDGICLGDLVTVYYSDFDIRTKLEVVQTDYNVLLDRYDSIELGAILPTLADTIASLK